MIDHLTIYVERKKGRDFEANKLAEEIRSALNLDNLKHIRLITIYEVSGLSRNELETAAPGLLYERPSDYAVFDISQIFEITENLNVISRELLPGQFDQRADSAARGLRLLYPHEKIEVRRGDLIISEGKLSSLEIADIKGWLINPVDSRTKDLEHCSLGENSPDPEPVPVLNGFRDLDAAGLNALRVIHGLALGAEDLDFIRLWFTENESRDPTLAELKALDTYWSDHCRHTTFETELTSIEVADGPEASEIRDALAGWDDARIICNRTGKPRTLMDLATIAAREARKSGELEDWDVSEEINACTLKVTARINGKSEPWLLSFKNETHNHPTEIEPYGGASTCLGGAVRDPLSGRAYVHQALRVSGGADPRKNTAETRPGKLPQRLIAHAAAEGYAGYGNQLGLATALVREHYHPGYEAKRLECGAVMGASPAGHVVREIPEAGDQVILVGGRTGRDGIGGATGSSRAHDGESLEKAGAEVQKGNAPEERKLQRLFRNPEASSLIRRCNDFGAGGVAVAVGELSDGLNINLDSIAVKYNGLDGLELALSESQERMAVVVRPEDTHAFIQGANEENLEAVIVAEITSDRRLRMTCRGQEVINLSRDLLDTNGVRRKAAALIIAGNDLDTPSNFDSVGPFTAANLKEVLSSSDVASRRGLEERFDGSVGGTTVLASHGGTKQATPAEASIHLLPADGDVGTAGIMSVGFDPALASISTFRGGQYALIEALARICSAGASWRRVRFSLQEFFGRTDQGPESWGQPLAALLGALTVQRKWCLPAIGGKDSMSGSYEELNVPPTIIAFAAAAMDAERAVGAAIPVKDLTLALVSGRSSEGNGFRLESPDFENLARGWDWIESLGSKGQLKAGASVGIGGWASKLVIMALGNCIGIELRDIDGLYPFASDYGAVIIASDLTAEELKGDAERSGVELRILGRSVEEPHFVWPGGSLSLEVAESSWRSPFSEVWPEDYNPESSVAPALATALSESPSANPRSRRITGVSRPRVCIPVFPGTNGEDDARRSFTRGGAVPIEHVFLDRNPEELEAALTALTDDVNRSQILFISGGFSAGDEPDGAGKYIAAVLRHEMVADAIRRLLERDGLVLGICNGFQALIKSGWLINGDAGIPGPDDPTLTRNRIGRHVARVVKTVATGAVSPWLAKIGQGDVHSVPVSHGEGRFVAPETVIQSLAESGRIAFQYCNDRGNPSMAGEFNPNGSEVAVEGIVSPCGRIMGKMGHSERWRPGTLIDVPGMEIEQPLIAGGIEWFR